jgi:hypothetical protein
MKSHLMSGIYKGACPLVRDSTQDRILELKEQIALMDEEPLRL